MNERRLAMMRLIDSRKKFTARELAERFNVSVRTIQRDLDVMQEMGFPLYTEVGVHGGYRVLPNRILPPLQLTQHEALGLFMMIQYLEKIHNFPYASIRSHLAEQYYSSLPADVQDMINRMRKHVAFLQHVPLQTAPLTTMILDAAVDKKEIKFAYTSRSGTKESQVYPNGIYYENGYWYMPAKNHHGVVLYRVDRMTHLDVLDQTDHSTPTLKEWLSSTDERKGMEVELQFTDFGTRLAESDVFFQSIHHNQWRGQIPPEEFTFMALRLLKYGPEVKVITPKRLKELVVALLEKSLDQYR